MNVSVVMTTYNGANKLLPQLISLRNQSRKADEVLIFDDCSKDQTVEVIQNFIYENHLYDWTLIENEHNKGLRRNFADALNTARGDLIFLCEQDGEWKADRIEKMAMIMEERDEIKVLSSDYDIRRGNQAVRFRKGLPQPYGRVRIEKAEVSACTIDPLRPGFTYVLRREMIHQIKSVTEADDEYDRVIWESALLSGGLYLLNEKLSVQIRYKDHERISAADEKNRRIRKIREQCALTERLLARIETVENRQWLEEYIRIQKERADAVENGSVRNLYALSKNSGFMPQSFTWLADAVSVIRAKL